MAIDVISETKKPVVKFSPKDYMWTEKYRPKKISEMVGDFKSKILKYLSNQQALPHFLLYSKTPGTGKCLGKSTPIIMFDGSIKNVQYMKKGDLLLGPDSKPRKVLSTTSGKDLMYKIKQKNGNDFIANKEHILSLVSSHTDHKKNIAIKNFITQTKHKQQEYKGYKTSTISFETRKVSLNPYFLGLWLGDGTKSSQRICNPDLEVIKFLETYAKELRYELKNHCYDKTKCPMWAIVNKKNDKNYLLEELRQYNLIKNKHIPSEYLINDTKTRLDLLAGLLDTDGHKTTNCYEIVQKSKRLANDIVYLARSLGFKVSIREKIGIIKNLNFTGLYYRIFISGDVWRIPLKIERKKIENHKRQKNHLRYGIEIKEIGMGDYYGFELDKDGLFLLGDFTVTHNTTLAKAIINELKCDALILNSSDDRKIDTIRDKVKEFSMTQSTIKGQRRCVFLDEFDGMLKASQEALRNVMETYANNVFFVLTCNNINKVILPLQSRCVKIPFAFPSKDEIVVYLKHICESESMEYTDEAIDQLIEMNYPSIRNCVLSLQDMKTDGLHVTMDSVKPVNDMFDGLWQKLLDKDWKYIKKIVLKSTIDPRELNSFFWEKALYSEPVKLKVVQICCRNERDISMGSDGKIIFVTSMIEMVK